MRLHPDHSGFDAKLSDHFGQASFDTVLETDSRATDVVENECGHVGRDKHPPCSSLIWTST
ncbi:hypothetical protein HTIA_2168 [Halorhabdus tiamatea SARL4B]|uniref:Uncharacterized protein n=1 Tax=Halorhabdus tiamatea SARL4B TaxID=1033806 RepID=F7PJG4_9EURY|nr:hypothetical protein HTIA_2168 [Halorhabdus tiamatea SARL4B]